MSSATLSRRLGAFAAGVEVAELPVVVRDRARDCLVHGLVVGAAGVGAGFGEAAEHAVGGGSDSGPATLLGSGRRVDAAAAAFANGALLHARAQEDTHGTFHAGVAVIPAVLATAEEVGADGATALAAIVAGYEVGIALSSVLTERTTPPFRATGVFGPVAAAAAVARVLGLDAERSAAAISLGAAFAGGSSEAFGAGTDEWHYQAGLAAQSGVLAARLAAAGASGSAEAFEGPAGYLEGYAGPGVDATKIGGGLGVRWNLLDVTFKPYPVCAFNQAPTMLLARMREQHGFRPKDVERILVRMNPREATYPGMPFSGPFRSTAQTLMSTRFCLAVAIARGHVDLAALGRFDDPVVLDLVARITTEPEPGRDGKTAHARIELRDGRVIEDAIEDSQSLLSWNADGVRENAWRLRPETALSEAGLEALIGAIDRLDESPDVSAVVAGVRGARIAA